MQFGTEARKYNDPEDMAAAYLVRYFGNQKIEYPINPFQMLKEIPLLQTILKLYGQQMCMYENKTHTVEKRIVSIRQPWLRPIVRGKAKAPVEFGAKQNLSIDENGYGRIGHLSFEAYWEGQGKFKSFHPGAKA